MPPVIQKHAGWGETRHDLRFLQQSFVVLDFFLAQNTPPVALWACRLRFFAPRGIARSEIRFARMSLCKGALAPLQPYKIFIQLLGSVFSTFLVVDAPRSRQAQMAIDEVL